MPQLGYFTVGGKNIQSQRKQILQVMASSTLDYFLALIMENLHMESENKLYTFPSSTRHGKTDIHGLYFFQHNSPTCLGILYLLFSSSVFSSRLVEIPHPF